LITFNSSNDQIGIKQNVYNLRRKQAQAILKMIQRKMYDPSGSSEKMRQNFMLAFGSSSPVLNEYMIKPNAFGNTQNQHHMEHSLTWLTLAIPTTIYLMFVNVFDICFISFSFRIGQTFYTMLFVVVYFQL